MRISAIKPAISFRGEKDEDQPLSPALREVFSDKIVPSSSKRLLWELSEVPDFYEASKNLKKDEFIKLSNYIKSQETNLLEMALKGDIRIISKANAKRSEGEGESFFRFRPLVKQNNRRAEGAKKNIFEYIQGHPVLKIINDAIERAKEFNVYPEAIPYSINKDEKGVTRYALLTGSAFNDHNAIIIFKDKIKGKNDFKCKYTPVPPASVEGLYPVEPESIKFFDYTKDIPDEIKKSVNELSKIPYFNNLICSTHPVSVANLAKINVDSDGMLAKMFRGDATIGIFDPASKKEQKRPFIDKGKMLIDKKEGRVKQTDLLGRLAEETLAIESCYLYENFSKQYPGEKLKYSLLGLTKGGISVHNVTETKSKEEKRYVFPGVINSDHPLGKRLAAFIEKVPYKKIALNFNENKTDD